MSHFVFLFEPAANFMEAWICYHFIQLFRSGCTEDHSRRIYFIILSFVLAVTMQIASYYELFSFIATLWFVFYICLTAVFLFQADIFHVVSLVSFYIMCVYTIDFFCISVMGVFAKNQQFARFVISQLSLWRCWYRAADLLLLLIFYLLVSRTVKKELRYNARILFAVTILGSLGVGFLSWLTIQETNLHTLFSWSLCIVLLFYSLILFYTKYMKAQETQAVLQLKDEMIQKEYQAVFARQKEQETLSHDLKNHLLILAAMIHEANYVGACDYIERLGEPLSGGIAAIWTGNRTLDVLLSHAKNKAEQNNIRFVICADAVSFHEMKDNDICCLFGNLFDNALEGAASENNGWIKVSIRKANEMIFVEIYNSSGKKPHIKGGRLVSVKQDGRLHGFGLGSAQRAAEKYSGTLEYQFEQGKFFVVVQFLNGLQAAGI